MTKEQRRLIIDLGWERKRMSSSGQETHDKLVKSLKGPFSAEEIIELAMLGWDIKTVSEGQV